MLVSCYDLDGRTPNDDLATKINNFSAKGNVLFLDSGLYESTWKRDSEWLFDDYGRTVSLIKCDFYSSFDVFPKPNQEYTTFFKQTIRAIRRSQALESEGELVPIVHSRGEDPRELVKVVRGVIKAFNFKLQILSVPERELGPDIIQRVRTIQKIRNLIDQQGHETVLHLLGCGDPVSLALFVYFGVDSFDSLDWLKFALDPNELRMRHFSHLALIDCNCFYCSRRNYIYFFRVLLHNLHFYYNFLKQIGKMITDDEIKDFVKSITPKFVLEKLRL